MLKDKIQMVIKTYEPPKSSIKPSLTTKNIETLKERGFLPRPTYNIPNHLYFYFQH